MSYKFLKGGILLARDGDSTSEAMRLLMEAARADNADAQHLLAKLYREGQYVPRDKQAADEWLKYAADLGLASANIDYARLTLQGKSGSDQDVRDAIDRLILAAEQGSSNAALNLAHVFQGIPNPTAEDLETARRYARFAHDHNEPEAAYMLAVIALRSRDRDTAIEWLRIGASQGDDWRVKYAHSLVTEDGIDPFLAIWRAAKSEQHDAIRRNMENRAAAESTNIPPVVLHAPEPPIPPSLTLLNTTISVTVEFVVDPNGIPGSIKLLEPTPYEALNDSIVETLAKWHFKPGVRDGRAVHTRMRVPIVFNAAR